MKQDKNMLGKFSVLLLAATIGCGSDNPTQTSFSGSSGQAAVTAGTVAATAGRSGTSGVSAPSGGSSATVGSAEQVSTAGTIGTAGANGAAGSTAVAGGSAPPTSGTAAAPAAGSAGMAMAMTASERLPPTVRNPKYMSLAPPLGEPFPNMMPGAWTWLAVEGAVSRDGSPAGFYYKFSKTGSKNLLVYLAGGGVCADGFFCNMNPPNKDVSLTAENVGSGVFNIFGPTAEAQDPNGERWQSGIFKDDPANPARDWNMVFIPYVTGDVFFGSKPNGSVPNVQGTFQFVGKSNMQKFISRIVGTWKDTEIAVISGSSAGGIGALLNATYFADALIDLGNGARFFVLDDAGPFFDDQFLEVCIQKRYRELYALDASFPMDCTGCRSQTGGGLAKGVLSYLSDKYPEHVLGGFVDSDQDEIMKFFFSEGLENCSYIDDPIGGLFAYPADRYPAAVKNLISELIDPSRMSTYVWSGDLHQNLFQTATADRFYQKNGLEKTVAEWFAGLIQGKHERLGAIK